MVLEILGFQVRNVRAEHGPSDRSTKVADFNDPESDVDCFVSSMTISGTGINLHQQCHRGIILQMGSSLDKMLQLLGRIERIGQCFPVTWRFIFRKDSFHHWQEHQVAMKFACRLATRVQLHPALDGCPELQEVVLHAITQEMFAYPIHPYAWVRARLKLVTDYFDDLRTTLSRHFRIVAACILKAFPPYSVVDDAQVLRDMKKEAAVLNEVIIKKALKLSQVLGNLTDDEEDTLLDDMDEVVGRLKDWAYIPRGRRIWIERSGAS
jgi:hypothetical protein